MLFCLQAFSTPDNGNQIVSKLPGLLQQEPKIPALEEYGLQPRERGIVELIVQGLNNREIAERLFLSGGTVRNYLSNILEKLQLRDRTQIAVFY